MNGKKISILFFTIAVLVVGFLYLRSKDGGVDFQNVTKNINSKNDEKEMYRNDAYGFALPVPTSAVALIEEGAGDTLLITKDQGLAGQKYQIQISITGFEEDTALTIARIRQDIPDLQMQEPIEIKTDGTPTVAFYSTDGAEKYREIWFVRDRFLYQIIAPAEADDTTGEIMEGWKWVE